MLVALQSLKKSWFDKNASERTAAISEARTMPMPISSEIALGSGTDDSLGCKEGIMCSFLFLSGKYTISPFLFLHREGCMCLLSSSCSWGGCVVFLSSPNDGPRIVASRASVCDMGGSQRIGWISLSISRRNARKSRVLHASWL